ncbi:hypothetical protein [Spirillospora sp. CA-128828]
MLDAAVDDPSSEETAYLLKSPENALRMLASFKHLELGGGE